MSAISIASGESAPEGWYDALTDDPAEARKWRHEAIQHQMLAALDRR